MNQNSVKLIAFDLDGTLLNTQKEISEKSIETIHSLYEKGHKIAIATARPLRTIHSYLEKIKIPVYLVLQNGAAYSVNYKDFVVNHIEKKLFKTIVEYLCDKDSTCAISIMDNDHWYTISEFDYINYYQVNIGPQKITKQQLVKKNCTKILVNNCNISEIIKEKFKNEVNILETDHQTLIQIMSKNSSKEYALEKILEEVQLSKSNLICFGDDHNDIGMFKYSGYCIAMGNSINQLKDIASYITETNDNEGINKFFSSERWNELEKT